MALKLSSTGSVKIRPLVKSPRLELRCAFTVGLKESVALTILSVGGRSQPPSVRSSKPSAKRNTNSISGSMARKGLVSAPFVDAHCF